MGIVAFKLDLPYIIGMSLCKEGFRSVFIAQISNQISQGRAKIAPQMWQTLQRLLHVLLFFLALFWFGTIFWVLGEKPWNALRMFPLVDKPLFYALAMYFLASQIEGVVELDSSYARATGKLGHVVFCESIATILQAVLQLFGSMVIDKPSHPGKVLVIFGITKILQSLTFFLLIKYPSLVGVKLSSSHAPISLRVNELTLDKSHDSFSYLLFKIFNSCRRNFLSTILGNLESILMTFFTNRSPLLTPESVSAYRGSYLIASHYGTIPSRLIHAPVSEAIKQTALSRTNSFTTLSEEEALEVLSRIRLSIYWALGILVFGSLFKDHLLAILLANRNTSLDSLSQISYFLNYVLSSLAFCAIAIPIETELSASIFKVAQREVGSILQYFDILSSICAVTSTSLFFFFVNSPFDIVLIGSLFGQVSRLVLQICYFRSLFPHPKMFMSHILPKSSIIVLFLCIGYMARISRLQQNPFVSSLGALIVDCGVGGVWFLLICGGMY